jgi:hypothetical protein
MSLLIDGYNLLYAAGIVGRGIGPGGLERSRLALLNFLAESLDSQEIAQTTVVFDAADAPPGLPRECKHRGISVRYSAGYEDADALLEELIRADSAPRRLTVVSSDHRIQRAARRRRARAVDSDVWYAEIAQGRSDRQQASPAPPAKPPVPLSEQEVRHWLDRFGGEESLAQLAKEPLTDLRPASEGESTPDKPPPDEAAEIGNPFPPGYAEDLLKELHDDAPDDPLPP